MEVVSVKLSEKQTQIVNHDLGPILVKAGPGSGKTRVVIERIKKILSVKSRAKILALTFSNLAAEEMKERVVDDQSIEEASKRVEISTIHAFCLQLVQSRAYLIGLSDEITLFEDYRDRFNILNEIIHRYNRKEYFISKYKNTEAMINDLLNRISDAKKNFIEPNQYISNDDFGSIYKEYSETLKIQNAMDFDDILVYSYRILIENPDIVELYNKLYDYIIVDEAQDLNFSQYTVLKSLCGSNFNNLMFVGDANQSIYKFNGSNSEFMTVNFVDDYKPTIYELYENFRNSKAIIRYAKKIKDTDSETNYVYEGILDVKECHDEAKEAAYVIEKIHFYMQNGHNDIEKELSFEDIAIIARNKYIFNEIENLLKQDKIPYYFKKTTNGIEFESVMMKLFDLLLRLSINSKDILHMKDAAIILNKPINSIHTENIESLANSLLNGTEYFWMKEIILEVQNRFNFEKILKQIENHVYDSEMNENEKSFTFNDIFTYRKHWDKFAYQVPSEDRSLKLFRNYISLGKTQDNTDDRGVVLLTAHMSKGLQYEIVFIIGLNEGTFPDYRAIDKNSIEQEENNFFVALTRAKRICHLSYPKYKMMPWGDIKEQRKSRFIK